MEKCCFFDKNNCIMLLSLGNEGIKMSKKKYLLIYENGNQANLETKTRKEVEKIIADNKVSTLSLPTSVLSNFDNVGKIFLKSLNKNNAMEITEETNPKKIKKPILNVFSFFTLAVNPIAAPMMMYKIVNAVFGVNYLSKIAYQVESLNRKLDSFIHRGQAETYGKIRNIQTTVDDIEKEYNLTGEFSIARVTRLIETTNDLEALIFEYGHLVEQFERKSDLLMEKKKKIGEATKLIKEEKAIYELDNLLYFMALSARISVNRIWMIYYLIQEPKLVETKARKAMSDLRDLDESAKRINKIEELRKYIKTEYSEMNWLRKKFLRKELKETMSVDLKEDMDMWRKDNTKILVYREKDRINFVQYSEEEKVPA